MRKSAIFIVIVGYFLSIAPFNLKGLPDRRTWFHIFLRVGGRWGLGWSNTSKVNNKSNN